MTETLFKSHLSAHQWTVLFAISRGEVTHDFATDTYDGAIKSTVKSLIKRAYVKRPLPVYGKGAPTTVQISLKGSAALKTHFNLCEQYGLQFPGVEQP